VFGLGKLLMLPYSLPAAGIKYCINKVIEVAEQEMTDETPIKEELILLNMRFEDGEIDDAEFRRQEAPLLAQFSAIRAYRRQLAEEQLAGLIAEEVDERTFVVDLPEELGPPR
jgi:hypothetical protein